jgi:hypothetical protein
MSGLKISRKWSDLARKLIAFGLGSLSASVIIAIGAALGVDIPTALAAFLASAVGIVAGYFTTETVPELPAPTPPTDPTL